MTYCIEYASEDLRELCERQAVATRQLGRPGAKKLARRIKELEVSADSVALRQGPGDWHPINHDWPGCLGGELSGASTIIAQPIVENGGTRGWRVLCIGDCYKH
ncbi:hypothetical protein H5398_03295 [Tessaracoccus sp. MC1679]|uniref:hypothetical protein n=1 Tax=Tessaracoccus sp. MC1679 TaxID=2760313 RepID=UPI001602E689|nr:hypothetical protein [Tessaracoccus sp. MC1679]MBB1515005.1 hypothetical protein [Tessaracoccus sp. MC1679]